MYGFETPTITVRIRVVQSVWRSTYQSWRNSIAPWAKPTSPPVLTRPYSRSKMPCNGHQFGRKRRTSKPKLQNSPVNFNNLISYFTIQTIQSVYKRTWAKGGVGRALRVSPLKSFSRKKVINIYNNLLANKMTII